MKDDESAAIEVAYGFLKYFLAHGKLGINSLRIAFVVESRFSSFLLNVCQQGIGKVCCLHRSSSVQRQIQFAIGAHLFDVSLQSHHGLERLKDLILIKQSAKLVLYDDLVT